MLGKKDTASKAPPLEIKEGAVEDKEQILEVLTAVLTENLPVHVQINEAPFVYYSHFDWELEENANKEIVDSKLYLEEARYLLLAALDPPIGNIKIRNSEKVTLQFFTQRLLFDCRTSFQQMTAGKKICLAFPGSIAQKPQKRSAFRAPVDRNWDITAEVTRPSGISFNAKLNDISTGGTAFYSMGATPRIAEDSKVNMLFTYPEGHLETQAVVLGSFVKEGEQYFRTQFLVANYETARKIEALVTFVQRENIQKRNKFK